MVDRKKCLRCVRIIKENYGAVADCPCLDCLRAENEAADGDIAGSAMLLASRREPETASPGAEAG